MADEVRLINAEKLKRQLIEGDGHDDDRFTEGYNFAINEIRGYIDSMPTVEAEPVKQGRWEVNEDRFYPFCSNCKYEPPKELIRCNALSLEPILTKYCPNCGSENGTRIYRGGKNNG